MENYFEDKAQEKFNAKAILFLLVLVGLFISFIC
jgi:hypothetical protein